MLVSVVRLYGLRYHTPVWSVNAPTAYQGEVQRERWYRSFFYRPPLNVLQMEKKNEGVATQTSQMYCPLTLDGLRTMYEIAARLSGMKVVRYMRKEGVL